MLAVPWPRADPHRTTWKASRESSGDSGSSPQGDTRVKESRAPSWIAVTRVAWRSRTACSGPPLHTMLSAARTYARAPHVELLSFIQAHEPHRSPARTLHVTTIDYGGRTTICHGERQKRFCLHHLRRLVVRSIGKKEKKKHVSPPLHRSVTHLIDNNMSPMMLANTDPVEHRGRVSTRRR